MSGQGITETAASLSSTFETRDGRRTTGESTVPKAMVSTNAGASFVTGIMRLTYFTARNSETISTIRLLSGTTAAGATPTLVRAGVYSVASNGDLTLVASIANDTTIFAATTTVYSRSLTAPFDTVAGQRYAVGVLVVTAAAAPNAPGFTYLADVAEAPLLTGRVTTLSDLPASVVAASIADYSSAFYATLEV